MQRERGVVGRGGRPRRAEGRLKRNKNTYEKSQAEEAEQQQQQQQKKKNVE